MTLEEIFQQVGTNMSLHTLSDSLAEIGHRTDPASRSRSLGSYAQGEPKARSESITSAQTANSKSSPSKIRSDSASSSKTADCASAAPNANCRSK